MHCAWCHSTFAFRNGVKRDFDKDTEKEALAAHHTLACSTDCDSRRAGFAFAACGEAPSLAPGSVAWRQLVSLKRVVLDIEAAAPTASVTSGDSSKAPWTTQVRGAWQTRVRLSSSPMELLRALCMFRSVVDEASWFDSVAVSHPFFAYALTLTSASASASASTVTVAQLASAAYCLDRALAFEWAFAPPASTSAMKANSNWNWKGVSREL